MQNSNRYYRRLNCSVRHLDVIRFAQIWQNFVTHKPWATVGQIITLSPLNEYWNDFRGLHADVTWLFLNLNGYSLLQDTWGVLVVFQSAESASVWGLGSGLMRGEVGEGWVAMGIKLADNSKNEDVIHISGQDFYRWQMNQCFILICRWYHAARECKRKTE